MAYTAIDKSSDYFNTILYTGNGGNQTITGVGFTPDWVWFKSRDAGTSHALVDIVRGTNKVLYSETTSTQQTINAQTFNSDGFALVQDAGANSINSSGSAKVAWSWKANGAGATNEDGTINTTKTSANTTSGFSISTYTGTGSAATFGHGLGVAPDAVIVKNLGATEDWNVWIRAETPKIGLLNDTAAFYSPGAAGINGATITSDVIGLSTSATANSSGVAYVAYCFSSVQGFSKFGSYIGNGNADGVFNYLGFSPAFLLIKNATATENWYILDNKRPGYNTNNYYILPSTSGAEGTSTTLATSLLSNGFKINNADTSMNTSGQTYIYLAFAESPFVSSSGIPATAR